MILSKNTEISARLRDFGGKKFVSMAEFARALKISPQGFTKYLNGSQQPGNMVQQRLRALGCDIEWLMTGVSNRDHVPSEIDLVAIKVLDYPGKQPHTAVREPVVEYIQTENKGDTTKYGIVVRGDKMATEFRDGEIVIASKIARVGKTDLAIVTLHSGELIIARIHHQQKQLMCAFDNAKYPPRIVPEKEIASVDRIVEKLTRY